MNKDCLFCKIGTGAITSEKIYESNTLFAINDINPQAPIHVLVIPKGPYESMDDFSKNAPVDLISGFFSAVGQVARELGITDDGYRMLANHGADANQEVPHFHIHLFAGRNLGMLLPR